MALVRESRTSKTLCSLAIDEDINISTVDTLREEINKEMEGGYELFELNLESVEKIDIAGIQLLLAFRNELIRKGKELKLLVMSPSVTKHMNDYGVIELFSVESTT